MTGTKSLGMIVSVSVAAIFIAVAIPSYAQVETRESRPTQYEQTALDNAYVTVSWNAAPCAIAEPDRCEDRVILAMSNIEIVGPARKLKLKRGQVAVFKTGESYDSPRGGTYYEIAIKPGHPPVKSPLELIPPPKNLIIFQGTKFFIYEERLSVGDTRPRHSHSQRVEIRLSNGPMLHQWIWQGSDIKESEPSRVNWREPIIHEVRNIGDAPLNNFIMEFLPQK